MDKQEMMREVARELVARMDVELEKLEDEMILERMKRMNKELRQEKIKKQG